MKYVCLHKVYVHWNIKETYNLYTYQGKWLKVKINILKGIELTSRYLTAFTEASESEEKNQASISYNYWTSQFHPLIHHKRDEFNSTSLKVPVIGNIGLSGSQRLLYCVLMSLFLHNAFFKMQSPPEVLRTEYTGVTEFYSVPGTMLGSRDKMINSFCHQVNSLPGKTVSVVL